MANTGAVEGGGAPGQGTSTQGSSNIPGAISPSAATTTTNTTTMTPSTTTTSNKQPNGGILKNSNKPTHEALSKQVDKNFEGAMSEVGGVVALRSEHHVIQRVTFELFQQLVISYIVKEYKHAKDVKEGLKSLTCPKAAFIKNEKLEDPSRTLGEVDKMILMERVKDYVKRMNNLNETMDKAFHVIWGQIRNLTRQRRSVMQFGYQ